MLARSISRARKCATRGNTSMLEFASPLKRCFSSVVTRIGGRSGSVLVLLIDVTSALRRAAAVQRRLGSCSEATNQKMSMGTDLRTARSAARLSACVQAASVQTEPRDAWVDVDGVCHGK